VQEVSACSIIISLIDGRFWNKEVFRGRIVDRGQTMTNTLQVSVGKGHF